MVEETVRRIEKRGKALDLFDGICVRCGSTDNLEFDHINADRQGNTHLLSQLWGSSWDRILEELSICQVLCKDCHSLKSIYDAGKRPATHGNPVMYRKGCRCTDCTQGHTAYNRKYVNKEKSTERMRRWRLKHREPLK